MTKHEGKQESHTKPWCIHNEMCSHFQLMILNIKYLTSTCNRGILTGWNSIGDKHVYWNISHTSLECAMTKRSSIEGFSFLLTYCDEKKPVEEMRGDAELPGLNGFDNTLL